MMPTRCHVCGVCAEADISPDLHVGIEEKQRKE